jgi:hypothetical protein
MAQRVHRIMPPPGYLGCRLAVDEGDGCYVNDRWQRDDFGALRSVIQENREAKSSGFPGFSGSNDFVDEL